MKAQEIRNAVYRGEIVNQLASLNMVESWQKILGLKRPDTGQKDVELILRLFSLFNNWETYESPMLTFLNDQMGRNRAFESERATKFKKRFTVGGQVSHFNI